MGDRGYWIGTATFDSSYATGGESFTAANAGLKAITHLSITPDKLTDDLALIPLWDTSANKIMLLEANNDGSSFVEITSEDDVSALIVYLMALGPVRNQ